MRKMLVALAVGLGLMASPTAAEECVDAEIVLAVDISKSVTEKEFALQVYGYAAAFHDPRTVEKIQTSGPCGAVAFALFTWAGKDSPHLKVPWTRVYDQRSAAALGALIGKQPYVTAPGTHIGGAIKYAMDLLGASQSGVACRAINISGDGEDNAASSLYQVKIVRDAAVKQFIAVNGLPLMILDNHLDDPQLNTRPSSAEESPYSYGSPGSIPEVPPDNYYKSYVVGGPGSFLAPIWRLEDMGEALRKSLCRFAIAMR